MENQPKYEKERLLIEKVKAGDADAYYDLVSPYRLRLYRKACALTGNAEDAEDVLQEALVTAYRALEKFRGESGIYTWLYRITVNKCRDFLRARKSKREDALEPIEPLLSDERVSIEKNHELSEESRYLIGKINSLEKKYRRVLLLRYYEDCSYQEIADIVQVNLGTVKSRLFKARELLKGAILRNGKGEDYFESRG